MSFYDYIMFKPESQRDFSEILELMMEREFNIHKFYRVRDWKRLSEKLYNSQFKDNKHFELSFESLAYIINSLFGNEAIIAILKGKDGLTKEQLMNKVLEFKRSVREKFCKTNQIYLIANVNNMPINRYGIDNNGTIKLQTQDGRLKPISRCQDEGLFKFHSLSYLHCPDAEVGKVLNELNLLQSEGVFNEENEISMLELENIKRYGTFNVFKHIEKNIDNERD